HALRERELAEERAKQRRLAAAVRSHDRKPIAVPKLELERAEPEGVALDDGSLKMRDNTASARAGLELEVQAPRLPRLLDRVEPVEPPLRLSHPPGEGMRSAPVGA